MNRKKGTIIAAVLGIPLLIGLGAGVAIVVVNQLGYVKSSNTAESDKSSNTNESETSSTSSDPEEFYIGKTTKGSKVYIKPEDVSCKTHQRSKKGEPIPDYAGGGFVLESAFATVCVGNGYLLTLTDKKEPYTDEGYCAVTSQKTQNSDGTVNSEDGYNSNTDSFACIAAEKYGKYQPF